MESAFTMKKLEELPESTTDGQSVLHVIGMGLDSKHIAMSMAVMKPGERILEHTHRQAEEVYVQVRGRSTLKAGDKTVPVEGLTFFCFPPETPRGIVNDSDGEAVWIFIGAPIDEYLEESAYPLDKK